MLDLLFIAVIVVCIVDISGFTDSWKSVLKRIMTKGQMDDPNYSLKPFDCSLCLDFWIGLIYLLAVHKFTLCMIAVDILIAVMTPVIKDIVILVREVFEYIIRKGYEAVR